LKTIKAILLKISRTFSLGMLGVREASSVKAPH
jgi:hypothetical protein